jgi:hypothetical protein
MTVILINTLMKRTIKNFMKDFFFTLIAVMLFLPLSGSCDTVKSGKPEKGTVQSGLRAVLYPDSESFRSGREARVNARIINGGSSDANVDMWSLGQSMIALKITREDTGERMLPVGPATPRSAEEMKRYIKVLGPGEKIEICYTLHVFSPELPRGTYHVQMATLPSNSVSITIR